MEIYNRPWPVVPNKVRADGGRELDRFRGVEHPADTPNGAEAWVGSLTRANGATRENPNLGYAEVILPDGTRDFLVNVVKRAPETILGKKHMEKYGTSLGMLIKMLDAKAPFLLQCHPTRENARKYWNSRFGKEECWYVLGTRKDIPEPPYILLGFKEDSTREKFEAAYRKGDAALLESFCHKIPVQPGESYMIPGGVPHALGAGCFVAEIQEPSDLTAVPFPQEYLLAYRRKANPFGIFEPEDEQLYESRMLNSFHYEGLPLDKLLDRLKSKEPVLRQEPGGREIEIFGDRDTSYFSCTMVTVSGAMARKNTGDVQIGIVVSGEGCIRCGENALPVKPKVTEPCFMKPRPAPDKQLSLQISVKFPRLQNLGNFFFLYAFLLEKTMLYCFYTILRRTVTGMAVQNTSLAALLLRIENSLPNLSKSERKVAEYIRANPRGIIDLSVAALADACGVSDPTVVRAYKKLGFSGYEDLKLTLAQATVSPDEIIHEEISAEDSVQAVRDKVFQSAVLALQFTRDMLEPETLAAAAQLLMNARKIVIFGLGGSAPVAMDLHHKLLRLGLNAAVYTDPHLQVIACNYLDERDAVFAVSHSGSSRCVVDSTQIAKHRGAKVISLTSAGKNPLSKLADISLNTNSKETKYRVVSIASRVAALTIADSIYTYIAMRTDGAKSLQIEKSMESLKY